LATFARDQRVYKVNQVNAYVCTTIKSFSSKQTRICFPEFFKTAISTAFCSFDHLSQVL